MLDLVINTDLLYSDESKDTLWWEATNEFFPEIVGVGKTEAKAIAHFIVQLPRSTVH